MAQPAEHIVHTVPDLNTAYAGARRAYRAAWFAYQAASGDAFLPAMDAWIATDREVKRLEALYAAGRLVAA